jgi:hypothetical protein
LFFRLYFVISVFILIFAAEIKDNWLMTSFALNNLWTYLQGLSLSRADREWLANKLIMPAQETESASKDETLKRFLEMEGIWSESEEGEEYYQMMKHRNDDRPLNREINLDD